MITRSDYMKDSENLHHDYHIQFATVQTRQEVLGSIGTYNLIPSTDIHLNDVKLPFNNLGSGGDWWWDTVTINLALLKALGGSNSNSTRTCVGKAVAKVLIKEHRESQC
jgi:hypothetical protein